MITTKKYILQNFSLLLPTASLLLLLNACSKEPGDLVAPKEDDNTVELKVTHNNVPADNYTYAEISAITQERPGANDEIVFSTTNGSFSNGSATYTVNVGDNDTTRAFLKYSKAETVKVTAQIYNKYTKECTVNFTSSYPTLITVSPDSSSLLPLFTSKCTIHATLTRQAGNVSEGMLLNYYDSVATSTGGSIGSFHNNTYTNAQGQTSIEYRLQDTSYHGFVFIKSYIDTDAGRVKGINKIYIH